MYNNQMNGYFYPQQQQQYQPQIQRQMQVQEYQQLKGHQVSCIDEARVAQIDFDGSISYFPDLANKKIYTKQINMDGTATVNVYSLEIPKEPEAPQWATKAELENAISGIRATIEGMMKHDEPKPNNAKRSNVPADAVPSF